MVRQWQTLFYQDRRSAVAMANPDFVLLAEAYGMKGIRASTMAECIAAVDAARLSPEAVLIDFVVDPEASVYPLIPPGGRLQDMLHEPSLQTP
jgi:acetolactate synthase-1/2/3 large subunit